MADYKVIRDGLSQKYFQKREKLQMSLQTVVPELGLDKEEKEPPLLQNISPWVKFTTAWSFLIRILSLKDLGWWGLVDDFIKNKLIVGMKIF